MKIYIPTIGRVGRQVTWKQLTDKLKKNAVLVVPPAEAKAHGDIPVLVHPPKMKSIGPVRDFIIDRHLQDENDSKLIMLDDDLTFATRSLTDPKKFITSTPKEIDACFAMVEKALKTYAHVSIRHREMAQDADEVEYCCRALRALAYDVKVLKREGVRFNRCKVMEDFDVTLQLLRKGYANAVLSRYIQNQGGSQAAGGCSTWRTMEVQAEGARALHKLHPDFVKLVEKTTKTAWGGGTRTDVVVSWKKAFSSSGADLYKVAL